MLDQALSTKGILHLKSSYSFAPSVTFRVDKGLITNGLSEVSQEDNNIKNPIVRCKDRIKNI